MSDGEEPTIRNQKSDGGMTRRQWYNIVSDTVTGANIRIKDNVIQALVIVACLVLGAIIGAFLVDVRLAGAFVGGFIGLLVGWLGSGVFLMVYRAVMHIRGRHD